MALFDFWASRVSASLSRSLRIPIRVPWVYRTQVPSLRVASVNLRGSVCQKVSKPVSEDIALISAVAAGNAFLIAKKRLTSNCKSASASKSSLIASKSNPKSFLAQVLPTKTIRSSSSSTTKPFPCKWPKQHAIGFPSLERDVSSYQCRIRRALTPCATSIVKFGICSGCRILNFRFRSCS